MKYIDILERSEPLKCEDCSYRSQNVCTKLSKSEEGTMYIIDISQDVIDEGRRLHDCPIRTLPEKQVCNYYEFETFTNGVSKGWNDCIDHITGEGTVQ